MFATAVTTLSLFQQIRNIAARCFLTHQGVWFVSRNKFPMDTTQRRTKLLFSKLIRTCKDLLRNPAPEKVHQFRTTLRRIESAVAMASLELSPKEKKLLAQLNRVRKLAGRLRDVDVQLQALSSLSIDRGFDQKKQVQQALERKRKRRAEKMGDSLQEFSESLPKVVRLGKRVVDSNQSVGASEVDYYQLAMDQWSLAVAKYELNSRRQIPPESLHDLRLDLKRVRYTAEMAGSNGNGNLIAQAKRIQDAIGEWRDWATLTETAERELNSYQNSSLVALLKNVTGARQVAAVRTTIDVSNEVFPSAPPKKSPGGVHLGRREKKTS
jgi:CHAD domain-containing protein